MNYAAILAALSGAGALANLVGGGGSGLRKEQKRLLGTQADILETQRDLIKSRAGNEEANMPQVLSTIFQAVNNQLGRPRSQVLGPNFQPRLQQRGTVNPLKLNWTPYTPAVEPPPDPVTPAATGPANQPAYGSSVPPVDPGKAAQAAMALLQGDTWKGVYNAGELIRRAATPAGQEALYNPYAGREMAGAQGKSGGGAGAYPTGSWVPPGADAATVPPGGTTDLTQDQINEAQWRQFAGGVQRFTHLPPVQAGRTMDPQQSHDWVEMLAGHAVDPLNPDVPRVYRVSQDEAIKWVQSGKATIIQDPLTGQAWRNPDNSTMIQVTSLSGQQGVQGNGSAIPAAWGVPPKIAATLATQQFNRDPITGIIYNSLGGIIYRGNPDKTPAVVANNPRARGPRKVRK